MKSRPDKLVDYILFKFSNAFEGLFSGLRHDLSIKTQYVFGLIAVAVAWIFKFSVLEWAIWLLCIALVLGFEYMNSALESLCDVYHEEYHPLIKQAKNFAAAAVLIVSLLSLVIGCLFIFKVR